jgi:uncharacterized membrane protein
VATGDLRRPTRRQRKRIDAAVARAEAVTGLQLCIVLGAGEGDPRARAEAVFVDAGLVARPAVLLLVDPKQHRVEVVTSPSAQERISDAESARAVAVMTERFGRGDLVGGLTEGVARLAESAGPGVALPDATDVPNLFEDD